MATKAEPGQAQSAMRLMSDDELAKISDEELLDRMLRAHYKMKYCQTRADMAGAQLAREDLVLFKYVAVTRMRRQDPVLRNGKHGT